MSTEMWWALEDGLWWALCGLSVGWCWQERGRTTPWRAMLALGLFVVTGLMCAGGWRLALAKGSSMAPALSKWSVLLLTTREMPLARGSVVVFRLSGDPGSGPRVMAKRIVAVGGERVEYRWGGLRVNGQEVKSWEAPLSSMRPPAGTRARQIRLGGQAVVVWAPLPGLSSQVREAHVPRTAVFVMGDHWANSRDSRDFGPVATTSIRGRVLAAWSLEMGWKRL